MSHPTIHDRLVKASLAVEGAAKAVPDRDHCHDRDYDCEDVEVHRHNRHNHQITHCFGEFRRSWYAGRAVHTVFALRVFCKILQRTLEMRLTKGVCTGLEYFTITAAAKDICSCRKMFPR